VPQVTEPAGNVRRRTTAAAVLSSTDFAMTTTLSIPSHPVTRETATDIAWGAITRLKHGAHLALLHERTVETEWGWVFYFNTRQFAESRDPLTLLPGCGPLVIEREDGAYTFLSTSMAPDQALAMYERCRTRALKLAPRLT
jgi:hypothetical protein